MKKSTIISTLVFTLTLLFSTQINAQKFSGLDKSPMDAATHPSSHRVSDKVVKVVYSRPQLKGRSLSNLAPNGKVWRTGANEAPEITFYKDVSFGGQSVNAGTYSLFTIPGDSEWTVILSKDINVWGAYSYNKANDLVRVSAPVSNSDDSLEAFSIAFGEDGTMHLGWGTTRASVSIK